MKYIKALLDSIYVSYIGYFGGRIEGRTLYILWPIRLVGRFERFSFDSCNFVKMFKGGSLFMVRCDPNEFDLDLSIDNFHFSTTKDM